MLTFNRFTARVQALCQSIYSCDLTDSNARQELELSLTDLGLNPSLAPLANDRWAKADHIIGLVKEALACANVACTNTADDTLTDPGLSLERFEIRMKALAHNEGWGSPADNPKINMSFTQQGHAPYEEVARSISEMGLSWSELRRTKVWTGNSYHNPLAQDYIPLELLLATVRQALAQKSPA